jgi:4-amino-4-deoxy-L-arabinose transferase-like glycosyltransferase
MFEGTNANELIHKFVRSPYLVFTLFLALFIIRILYLDADPLFIKELTDVGDEGYWVHNARNVILFDNWMIDDFNQSLSASPLYALMLYVCFRLFGFGLLQDHLVSAIISFLTLMVLYLFIKDVHSKKAALYSVLILGFNAVYLAYNKLGQVETSMIFFLLLAYYLWYKGNSKRVLYFISGIFFALAVLTKITAIYFSISFLLLWALEKVRNNDFEWKTIGYFIAGLTIPLLTYIIFLAVPYWNELSPFLSSVSGGSALFSLSHSIASLAYNSFFGLIPVYLLLILIICYLTYLLTKISYNKGGNLNIKGYVLRMDWLEIMVLAWLLGGLAMLLCTDFATRRFLVFLIPMTLILTKIWVDNCQFKITKMIWTLVDILTDNKPWARFLVSLVIVFPFYAAFIKFFKFGFIVDDSTSILLSLLATLLIIVFLISPYLKTNQKIRHLKALTILTSLAGWFILPLINLLNLNSHFLSVYLHITLPFFHRIAIPFLIIIIILLLFTWNQELFKVTRKFTRNLLIIYLLVNILIIGVQFTSPSYTIAEGSKGLQDYISPGDVVIGPWGHELSFENQIFPLWYLPYDSQFKSINQNLSQHHPRFLLTAEKFVISENLMTDHDTNKMYPTVADFKRVKLIKKIYLCPYPYTNQSRVILNLYEIQEP